MWRIRHLLERYGSLVHELFALAENDRTLYEPLPGAEEYLKVEIRYAATHEAALHLDDFLTRRTRVSIETRHRGTESARAAADIVAPVFGWDDERVEAEVAAYLARVDAELESQQEIVDTEANAERLSARSAPDPGEPRLSSGPKGVGEAAFVGGVGPAAYGDVEMVCAHDPAGLPGALLDWPDEDPSHPRCARRGPRPARRRLQRGGAQSGH